MSARPSGMGGVGNMAGLGALAYLAYKAFQEYQKSNPGTAGAGTAGTARAGAGTTAASPQALARRRGKAGRLATVSATSWRRVASRRPRPSPQRSTIRAHCC